MHQASVWNRPKQINNLFAATGIAVIFILNQQPDINAFCHTQRLLHFINNSVENQSRLGDTSECKNAKSVRTKNVRSLRCTLQTFQLASVLAFNCVDVSRNFAYGRCAR